ncbi:unnamed protein product [Gongylonema pulchrum]|uniref:FAM192A_Fyv6_N domain-containing protein n=1 Tax=Gongylonema pulchrum TaxID=637853 RepID=A0A183DCT9_9BILA|nr:unnamed protein product [Gongylonema pulchrum]
MSIFRPSTSNAVKKPRKKDAPMFLKDYERKLILEKGGDISEEEENAEEIPGPGYYEQQESIKKELKAVLAEQGSDNEDSEPLLKHRVKTEQQLKKEEDDYYEWLKGQKDSDLPPSGAEELVRIHCFTHAFKLLYFAVVG